MASKKPAAAKTAARKAKSVSKPEVAAVETPVTETDTVARADTFKRVWALPIAMLMLVIAAGGLWFAVRESSNAPQAATPAATAAMKPDAPSAATTASAAATPASVKPAETTTVAAAKPVSITGCLQRADSGFVLRDTEGADAPKARSWKSGFFKKHNAAIDLNDSANAAHLGSHVGQRVSVTGPLVDREMQVQSVRRLAAACS